MGADLYINKLRSPIQQQWQPKFDEACSLRDIAQDDVAKESAQKLIDEAWANLYSGDHYFRDSYSGSSVLHRLGLSWWRDMEYDVEYVEGNPATEINVSADACLRFRDKVLSAELKPATLAQLKADGCRIDDGDNTVDAWNRLFVERRDRLVAFLNRAAEHGGMYASC